jgi:hypothetical protein
MCSTHYQRQVHNGSPYATAADLRRAANGGKLPKPYKSVGVGSKKVNGEWRTVTRLAHRVLVERFIDRPLLRTETVHHRNGAKDENTVGPCVMARECKCTVRHNLELWAKSQPAGQRVADLVAWAKDILARYEPAAVHGGIARGVAAGPPEVDR